MPCLPPSQGGSQAPGGDPTSQGRGSRSGPVLDVDELEAAPGGAHGGAVLPGPGRPHGAVGSCLAGSHQPPCFPAPLFSHTLQIFYGLFVLPDASASRVFVAPWTVFSPVDGHLPLQHYQSGVKCPLRQFGDPLTHTVTHLHVVPAAFSRWTMQVSGVVNHPGMKLIVKPAQEAE